MKQRQKIVSALLLAFASVAFAQNVGSDIHQGAKAQAERQRRSAKIPK